MWISQWPRDLRQRSGFQAPTKLVYREFSLRIASRTRRVFVSIGPIRKLRTIPSAVGGESH